MIMSLSDKQIIIEQSIMLIGHIAYWKVFVAKIPYMKDHTPPKPHYVKCDYCREKMPEPLVGFKMWNYLYNFCCDEHATMYLDENPRVAQQFEKTFNNPLL